MGGQQSKTTFICGNGSISDYFNLPEPYNWISSGPFPAFSEMLDCLENDGVGAVVTLTLEKVHPGLVINHQPVEFDDTEWTYSDVIGLDRFTWFHCPIQDGGWPSSDTWDSIKSSILTYHAQYPDKKIYIHCWAGKGRCWAVILKLLTEIGPMSLRQAYSIAASIKAPLKINSNQTTFLENKEFISEQLSNNIPQIKTHLDSECYKQIDKAWGYQVIIPELSKDSPVSVIDLDVLKSERINDWCKLRLAYLRRGDIIKIIYWEYGWSYGDNYIWDGHEAIILTDKSHGYHIPRQFTIGDSGFAPNYWSDQLRSINICLDSKHDEEIDKFNPIEKDQSIIIKGLTWKIDFTNKKSHYKKRRVYIYATGLKKNKLYIC
jgi:hypothetical protein